MLIATSLSPNTIIYMLFATSLSPNTIIYMLCATSLSPNTIIYMLFATPLSPNTIITLTPINPISGKEVSPFARKRAGLPWTQLRFSGGVSEDASSVVERATSNFSEIQLRFFLKGSRRTPINPISGIWTAKKVV